MSEGMATTDSTPKWTQLAPLERRILGVLVEKAKTTPDQYPMTLNGLCNGCNQKSNRFPQMNVETEDIEDALDRLRSLGAVTEVQGSGRVSKYRHFMYEWMGVEKLELAVMAELLLRGAQTEGELRGRASRMDPIPDLTTLRDLLDSLKAKGLVIPLTPEGRGHVITHALYQPRELERLQAEFKNHPPVSAQDDEPLRPAPTQTHVAASSGVQARANLSPQPVSPQPAVNSQSTEIEKLTLEVHDLRGLVVELREQIGDLSNQMMQTADELQALKDSLGA